jgi:hypothetical protein
VSYHEFITVRMSSAMRAELIALAARHETDVGKLVRDLIAYELAVGRDRMKEAFGQLLFLAIAMDELLAAHSEPDLRDHVIRQWRARIAEEGTSDAA